MLRNRIVAIAAQGCSILLGLTTGGGAATLTRNDASHVCALSLSGPIKLGDNGKLAAAIEALGPSPTRTLCLDSPGGAWVMPYN